MAEKGHNFSGAERAAILLMSMGEEHAASVLRRMGPRQVQKVGTAMSSLSNISGEQINSVVQEFLQLMQGQGAIQVGGENYVRKVLTQAFGDENADTVINSVLNGQESKGLQALQWYKEGKMAQLADYCKKDVLITRDLFLHGLENGFFICRPRLTDFF